MSCEEIHGVHRQSVCPSALPHRPGTWGRMMHHTPPSRSPLHAGWSAPTHHHHPYPLWFMREEHQRWQGYTEEDWRTITALALELLSRVDGMRSRSRSFGQAAVFPSSLLLLTGPMSGIGDPDGTIARQILHRCHRVVIPNEGIPDLARILAHGWMHPAITDDMIRWCANIVEQGQDRQMVRLAAQVVGLGIDIPDVRDRLPDDLIDRIITHGRVTVTDRREQEAYLPVFRSLLTHLADHRVVVQWLQRIIDQPRLGMLMVIRTIATMDPFQPIPDRIASLIHEILDGHPSPETTCVAAQWMVNPAYRPAVEAFLDRATTTPYRTMVLSALARAPYTGVWFRWLPLVEQSLVSRDPLQWDAAIQVLCHWMQDVGASAFLLDRIMDFVQRTEYPMERLIPVMARSYRSLARTGAMLDPRVIDTMVHHCQTYYDQARTPIAETLGGLMEDGTPDAAERALHVCRALITSWDSSHAPLMTALCRGLAGPCAQEVSDTLMSLVSIPEASSAMLDALISIPSTDRGRQYRDMIATRVLFTCSEQEMVPPNLPDSIAWAFHHLPLATAIDLAKRCANHPHRATRLYSLIGLLAYGDQHAAWNACADIDAQGWFDGATILDAWLWGLSIAPPKNAPWLASCSRRHQGVQSVLNQGGTSTW